MCDTFNLIGIIPYDKSDHNIQSRIANQCDKNFALSDEIMLIEFEEELSRLIKKEVDILKEFFIQQKIGNFSQLTLNVLDQKI